jgi:hypothetical protein
MSTQSIPLLWDTGEISQVLPDRRGILRLRPSRDAAAEQNLEFLQGAARLPSGWPASPLTYSPSISPVEAGALMEEIAWHHR